MFIHTDKWKEYNEEFNQLPRYKNIIGGIIVWIIIIAIIAGFFTSAYLVQKNVLECNFGNVTGLVPGFGEVADGINAIIYLANGDYVNASLSLAAMIPIGGQLATAGKLGMKELMQQMFVYRGIDKSGAVKYVGITQRAPGVRFGEHLNSGTAKSL